MTATWLAGCEPSELPDGVRITLPPAPADLRGCFAKAFPDIPDRPLTKADVVRIIGAAKIQDRMKAACGQRAVDWIDGVIGSYAKAPAARP